jgi:hypothetical protein
VIEGVSTQHSAKEHRRRFPLTGADQQKIRPRISRMKESKHQSTIHVFDSHLEFFLSAFISSYLRPKTALADC